MEVRPSRRADVAPDGAKSVLAVGQPDVPAIVDRQHDELRSDVADELLERAMQLVAAAFAARADDQVRLARLDRRDELRDVVRVVRAVGVDEDEDLVVGLVEREAQRFALAAPVVAG